MIRISQSPVVVALVLVCGCRHNPPSAESLWRWAGDSTSCRPDAPASALPEALRDRSIHPFRSAINNYWEERANIARMIPGGFGGISWREKDPRTVVYLKDTTRLVAAIPALVSVGFLPRNPRVGAIQARFTYAELYDWMSYIHIHIAGVRLAGWAIDERRNRITYFLEDEASALALNRDLTAMHAPCFLVAYQVTGPFRALSRAVDSG